MSLMTSTCPFSNLISQNEPENFVASERTNGEAECLGVYRIRHLEPALKPAESRTP